MKIEVRTYKSWLFTAIYMYKFQNFGGCGKRMWFLYI